MIVFLPLPLLSSQAVQNKGRDPAFHKLGSTFTGAAIQNGVLEFVQIGDSRAYLLRGDKIKQISKDQTLVQQLVDIGQISAEEAERHPYKHVLIQALGTETGVNPATGRIHLRRGDVVLLCSDGLSNKLEEEDLRQTIHAAETLAQACERLVNEANARGGEDNITVVLARVNGEDLPAPDDGRIIIERFGAHDYDETTTMGGISMEELQATLPSFPSDMPPTN